MSTNDEGKTIPIDYHYFRINIDGPQGTAPGVGRPAGRGGSRYGGTIRRWILVRVGHGVCPGTPESRHSRAARQGRPAKMTARGRPPLTHDSSADDWETLVVKLSADNLDTLDRFLTATGQLAVAAAEQLGRNSEAVDIYAYRPRFSVSAVPQTRVVGVQRT